MTYTGIHRFQWFGIAVCLLGALFFLRGGAAAADKTEEEVARIRKYYAEVEALQGLRQEDIEFQCPGDPMQGVLTRRSRRDTDEIVRLDLGYLAGDHGGADEMYYYRKNKLFFVLEAASWWGFSGKKEGQTLETMRERRFYFADGRCIKVLEKTASSERPEGLRLLIAKEENRELDLAEEATKIMVAGILKKADSLPKLRDAKALAKFFCGE
jgi:hypothetical protein